MIRYTPAWIHKLDSKGRCCGRKPIVYRRDPHLFCPRCDRSFNPETGEQIANWAYEQTGPSNFSRKTARR